MIRATVNLTTSAMLISVATSLKLPLSTTYLDTFGLSQRIVRACRELGVFTVEHLLVHLRRFRIVDAGEKGAQQCELFFEGAFCSGTHHALTADGYGVTSALNARTAAEAIRQRELDRKSTRLNSSH